ncbi:hypothetical protein [sulfur-oxidizing endosymbiont of Gigantopelta aegis]|uniref:hypothetical protein n=1 Tax=sulfur-oxidizing endosymbiont of Gigantopelta aegis TaxID=2794934 RepID=UPI0018DE91BB|nr:hypothetical protein [sulfur-oxidizing endosymbiont of Gigantopelta aegis]
MKEWRSPLKHTYEKILDLHERNWNGIWFRIVRNFFWSAIAGKFMWLLVIHLGSDGQNYPNYTVNV